MFEPFEDNRENKTPCKPKIALFVCTGNTYRSPMAEAIFNDIVKGLPWKGESAGLAAFDGDYAMPQAEGAAFELGLDLTAHRSRRLNQQMVERVDLIISMTENHKARIAQLYPESEEKLLCLKDIGGDDIPDPFGSQLETYINVAYDIKDSLEEIRDFLTAFTGKEEAKEK